MAWMNEHDRDTARPTARRISSICVDSVRVEKHVENR